MLAAEVVHNVCTVDIVDSLAFGCFKNNVKSVLKRADFKLCIGFCNNNKSFAVLGNDGNNVRALGSGLLRLFDTSFVYI